MKIATPDSHLPKISIVTPSYNQGPYLEKTIRSVLDQRYPALEYMIVDGGSTDESVAIIRKYESDLKFWVSEPDRGQSHAINKGLARATGDLFIWLNSDDFYMPDGLWKIADLFLKNPRAGAIVGSGQIVDSAGKVIYYKEPPDEVTIEALYDWIDRGHFMQPSSAFSRNAWEECGPLDEEVHIAFDLDFWLRIAEKKFPFVVTKELISSALSHQGAKTTAFQDLMKVDISLVILKHGGEQAARKNLETMAQRLAWSEGNLRKILRHPVAKILLPLMKSFLKPAVKWQDTIPGWRAKDSGKAAASGVESKNSPGAAKDE